MSWYWWLLIFIYVNGASFTAGISIHETVREELLSTILLVVLWPIALAGVFYGELLYKTKEWLNARKEDKLFHEKHQELKLERSGIKFDENGDIVR